MSAYLIDVAAFLLRWLHVVAAIAWIGESFYFVALDRGLKKAKGDAQGLAGESWSVHGGGFYLKQKFVPAPAELPEDLHWSKWKSYTTWLSGFALFALLYLLSPAMWLVDPAVAALTPGQAVAAALAFLALGWVVYDVLCRAVGFRDGLLGGLVGLFTLGLCVAATELFAGRAAFLIVGAVLATIMSANVFFVIIPGQRRLVAALAKGDAPNPLDGARGKQRSVHNTYFTLPVVFAMLSTHWATAYAHPQSGLVLFAFLVAGALIRQFFVVWHSGERAWHLLGAGGVLLVALFAWLAPKPEALPVATPTPAPPVTTTTVPAGTGPVTTADVHALLAKHCVTCHSGRPTLMASAPLGTMFDTPAQVDAAGPRIHKQVVELKVMPPGNLTGMTDAERAAIDRWFRAGGATP